MKFEVSVIIPVYRAADFVRIAVESALSQPEVREILLIEDASPDKSLEKCQELAAKYPAVRLYQHEGGVNKGAGATRNLGMEKARCPYISFLDADDYFLSDRFKETASVFDKHPDADGVYEAVGDFATGNSDVVKIYTINTIVAPEKLFHYLIRGTYGHFSTNGVTIKQALLKKAGIFDTDLRLHQDSELWLRFAFHGRLYPGCITKPVTMVRKHENNRITHANHKSRLQFWRVVIIYFKRQPIGFINYLLIAWKYSRTKAMTQGTNGVLEFTKVLTSFEKTTRA